jgi:hypothetical protein
MVFSCDRKEAKASEEFMVFARQIEIADNLNFQTSETAGK